MATITRIMQPTTTSTQRLVELLDKAKSGGWDHAQNAGYIELSDFIELDERGLEQAILDRVNEAVQEEVEAFARQVEEAIAAGEMVETPRLDPARVRAALNGVQRSLSAVLGVLNELELSLREAEAGRPNMLNEERG